MRRVPFRFPQGVRMHGHQTWENNQYYTTLTLVQDVKVKGLSKLVSFCRRRRWVSNMVFGVSVYTITFHSGDDLFVEYFVHDCRCLFDIILPLLMFNGPSDELGQRGFVDKKDGPFFFFFKHLKSNKGARWSNFGVFSSDVRHSRLRSKRHDRL